MKKIYLLFSAIILFANYSLAQNTFPTSGNVGIGTTSPTAPLHLFSPNNATVLNIQSSYAAGETQMALIGTGATYNIGTGNGQENYWGIANSWYVFDATNGAMRVVLKPSGFFGIGTTSPQSTLHVYGTATVGGSPGNLDNSQGRMPLTYLPNTGEMVIGWNRATGSGETDFIANQGAGGTGGFAFYNHDNNNNETQLMYIMGNGNVHVGTPLQATSNYKLDVNGNVRANQITVNTTGADFVFEPTYKLKPLSYVQRYIQENHHLPGIASAKKMQTEGLNLGDNQTKLLQKVEELTLYIIEKDKQLDDQQKLNQSQQQQLDKQQHAIDELKNQVSQLIKLSNKKQ